MAKSNEMWIAGGIVALGVAWYMMSDADAAPPLRGTTPTGPKPGPSPVPTGGGFTSLRCPNIESDLPDEFKKDVDDMIAAQLSSAEYGAAAQTYQANGWPNAAQCLAAAQLAAATREGLLSPKIPGGNSVDQTKTCSFWMSQYNHAVQMLNAAIPKSVSMDPAQAAAGAAEVQTASAAIANAKKALGQLGCPVP